MLKKTAYCCIKWLGFISAIFIVVFAVLIIITRATVPLLNNQRDFFEKWAREVLHQTVHIRYVEVGWLGVDPALKFDDVILTELSPLATSPPSDGVSQGESQDLPL